MFSLSDILQACKSVLIKIWTGASKLFPWLAPLAGLMSLYAVFKSNYEAVITYINGLTVFLTGQPAIGWLSAANRFFPISEACAMVLALLTLRSLAFMARFVRAMMPF